MKNAPYVEAVTDDLFATIYYCMGIFLDVSNNRNIITGKIRHSFHIPVEIPWQAFSMGLLLLGKN
ncbi:MAG: hypothetical protein ABI166_09665 [Mucilaginibacter sp.]